MNIDKLKPHIPNNVFLELPIVMEKYNINTTLRLAHFLSQCHHESAGFTVTTENLNYTAQGLLKIFSKYFTPKTAKLFERRPKAIANIVYANRMGNGNALSNDGYNYRGRGYIQCTGKNMYKELSEEFDVDFVKNPDLIATKYALASAAWFFNKKNINAIADKGSSTKIIKEVTIKINGGTNGLAQRITDFKKYHKILSLL
jgi:putative chitinase